MQVLTNNRASVTAYSLLFCYFLFFPHIILHHWQRHRLNMRKREKQRRALRRRRVSGRRGGIPCSWEAARGRHICRSINFQLCGAWVSTQATGARLQSSWSSDGGTKPPKNQPSTDPKPLLSIVALVTPFPQTSILLHWLYCANQLQTSSCTVSH